MEQIAAAARYAEQVAGWRRSQYDAEGVGGVEDWLAAVLYDLEGNSWSTGIESDRRRRGESINIACTDRDDAQRLALIQVRQARFRPNRYTRVRKDYYLVGRNENGNAFAHPVDATSKTPLRRVLAGIWGCDPRDLDDIRRNGDVAFVPVRSIPDHAIPTEDLRITVAGSHVVTGSLRVVWHPDGDLDIYTTRRAKIEHAKRQHPTARVRQGWFRVVVARRGSRWGFTRPTAD